LQGVCQTEFWVAFCRVSIRTTGDGRHFRSSMTSNIISLCHRSICAMCGIK